MWMFLRPDPAPELPEAVVEPVGAVEPADDGSQHTKDSQRGLARRPWPGAGRGTDDAFVPISTQPGNAVPRVRVYLHPGRRELGSMELDRIARQFDMRSAPLFGSLGEAELAADETAGFLLEVAGPFEDPEGNRHQSGVFFVAGLA